MKKLIRSVFFILMGLVIGASVVGKTCIIKMRKIQSMSKKHLALFLMMKQWVKVKQEEKSLSDYFAKNGFKKIAIYGMSNVGVTLFDELKDTGIIVAYGIDKNADSLCADIDIVSIEEDLDKVDVIVVTAITFYDEIEKKLSKKVNCPIISLEDILYEV